jgi:hypothetical protein
MKNKQGQTASFMVRFNQKIFDKDGESNVQWRGKISHVQGGEEKRFSDFNDALSFMEKKLTQLTAEATKNEPVEKQKGILMKSLSMWNTIKEVGPKVIMKTIKDPLKQVNQLQGQIQGQISTIGEEISEKVQIDQWRNASRSDIHVIMESINDISKELKKLNTKVNALSKKK